MMQWEYLIQNLKKSGCKSFFTQKFMFNRTRSYSYADKFFRTSTISTAQARRKKISKDIASYEFIFERDIKE